MAYAVLSCDFFDDPQVSAVGRLARNLWLRCLLLSIRFSTKGFVLERMALQEARMEHRARPASLIRLLCTDVVPGYGPMWIRQEGGYHICNYNRYLGHVLGWSKVAYPEAYERDRRACRYCGIGDDLTIDHITPRLQGGGDEVENLAVACRSCNSRKGGRTPEQAGMVLMPIPGGA